MRHAEPTPGTLPKIAISAALIALVFTAIHLAPEPAPPYRMVDEVALRPSVWNGERVRLHGWVKPGSIVHVAGDLRVFTLYRRGEAMRIWYRGPVPDTFRDQSEAIVTGTVERDGSSWWVSATDVMTKCGGKYDGFPASPRARFQ